MAKPEKILYYLGAGASAKAFPLAKSVWKVLAETKTPIPLIPGLAYELENFDFKPFIVTGVMDDSMAVNNSLSKLRSDFNELARFANEYGDVDTYAKYLNLTDPAGPEFIKLKITLSKYFALKQVTFRAKDPRYVPWLVSIMKTKAFPENVKVLSWNYDLQLEIAAGIFWFIGEDGYRTIGFIDDPLSFATYPNSNPFFSEFHRLSLIHLNGAANFFTYSLSRTGTLFQSHLIKDASSLFSRLTDDQMASNLHFAWEGGTYHTQLMKHAEAKIEQTTIMVVIGYSFPFFNREVDKQIFEKLKADPDFKKIYYQDPVLTGEQLRSQFDLPGRISIKHIPSTDNFYIPFEY